MPEQVLVYLLKYAEFFTTYSKGKNEQTFFVCINRLDRQELHRLILFQFKSNTCSCVNVSFLLDWNQALGMRTTILF